MSEFNFSKGYKEKVDAMQTLYNFKGSVETIDELQSKINSKTGDVYNCKADNKSYCYDGESWIDFGLVLQISGYDTSDEVDNKLNELNNNIKEAIEAYILEDNKKKYYIGKVVIDTKNVNPASYLGFGTWQLWGSGRVPVGVDTAQEEFNEAEKIGGSNSATLTVANLPPHLHHVDLISSENGDHGHKFNARSGQLASGTAQNGLGTGSNNNGQWDTNVTGKHTHKIEGNTKNTGSGESFSVMQSYITCYMWKRIA